MISPKHQGAAQNQFGYYNEIRPFPLGYARYILGKGLSVSKLF